MGWKSFTFINDTHDSHSLISIKPRSCIVSGLFSENGESNYVYSFIVPTSRSTSSQELDVHSLEMSNFPMITIRYGIYKLVMWCLFNFLLMKNDYQVEQQI